MGRTCKNQIGKLLLPNDYLYTQHKMVQSIILLFVMIKKK